MAIYNDEIIRQQIKSNIRMCEEVINPIVSGKGMFKVFIEWLT